MAGITWLSSEFSAGSSNGSIEMQGYSVSANYANSHRVNTTSSIPTELGLEAGQVIDTAMKAGGNGISLSFGASNAYRSPLSEAGVGRFDQVSAACWAELRPVASDRVGPELHSFRNPSDTGSFSLASLSLLLLVAALTRKHAYYRLARESFEV